jgi:hypothetical protein
MQFNPLTKVIYTDSGELIKTISCPHKVGWDNLEATTLTTRKCTFCEHSILDTAALTDEELLKTVRQNPNTCLKIDLIQHNINIITDGILGQK